MYCKNCGAERKEGSLICVKCGVGGEISVGESIEKEDSQIVDALKTEEDMVVKIIEEEIAPLTESLEEELTSDAETIEGASTPLKKSIEAEQANVVTSGNESEWVRIPEGATVEEMIEHPDRYQPEGQENPNKSGNSYQKKTMEAPTQEKDNCQGAAPTQGKNNYQRTAPAQEMSNYQGVVPTQGVNHQGTAPTQGMSNYQGTAPTQGMSNYQGTVSAQGINNFQGTTPSQKIDNFQGSSPLDNNQSFKEATHNLKGRRMVFVTSILLIIFGGLTVLSDLGELSSSGYMSSSSLWEYGLFLPTWYETLITYISLAFGSLQLLSGILGVVNSRKPEKATALVILSIVMMGVSILPFIPSVMVDPLLGAGYLFGALFTAILPVLLLIGALALKKKQFKTK